MPHKSEDEYLWICSFCGCEYDLEDPAIQIILPPSRQHQALIMFDGKPHNLVRRTWESHLAKIKAENRGLSARDVYMSDLRKEKN